MSGDDKLTVRWPRGRTARFTQCTGEAHGSQLLQSTQTMHPAQRRLLAQGPMGALGRFPPAELGCPPLLGHGEAFSPFSKAGLYF